MAGTTIPPADTSATGRRIRGWLEVKVGWKALRGERQEADKQEKVQKGEIDVSGREQGNLSPLV
jgi:hypothetical protein